MRLVGLIMSVAMAGPAALLAKNPRPSPKLSMEQAQKIALEKEPGKIESKELEKEHGKLIYSFDIRTAKGLHEVNVDAMTGSVIDDKVETPADEAKEKRKDAKQAKKKPKTPQ